MLASFPSQEQIQQALQSNSTATHVQLSCPLDFDCINPVLVLTALQHEPNFFLLESASAEKNRRSYSFGRYSFFGYQVENIYSCYAQADGTATLRKQKPDPPNPTTPQETLSGNPFDQLFADSIEQKQILQIPTQAAHAPHWEGFQGGLVGIFGYEAVRHMGILRKDLKQLSTPSSPSGQQAEILFYEVQQFYVIDNASQKLFAVYLMPLSKQSPDSQSCSKDYAKARKTLAQMVEDLRQKLNSTQAGAMLPSMPTQNKAEKQLAAELSKQIWQEDTPEAQQKEIIEAMRRELIAGEGLQVVYSVGRKGPRVSPSMFYRLLRRQNPSPYMFFFKHGEQHLVGSSPETHLRYQNGIASIKPIAGTRPLPEHLSDTELQAIIDDLLQDPKERAEHLMLIDLARNDLYTNCRPESVQMVKEFQPEVYSHVVHILSEVHGQLQEGKKPYELFAKTFPAGTLSGAPKVRAIELIDQYEGSPRGFYGGCIGYFNYDGSFDSAIVIRSAWIDQEKTLTRSGGGLVCESKPDYEIREHRQKLGILSTVLNAILQAQAQAD